MLQQKHPLEELVTHKGTEPCPPAERVGEPGMEMCLQRDKDFPISYITVGQQVLRLQMCLAAIIIDVGL